MKVEIYNIKETLDAVVALETNRGFVVIDKDINPFDTELSEYVNVIITCKGIMVTDDRITIEFSDGNIADFEVNSDEYRTIRIL